MRHRLDDFVPHFDAWMNDQSSSQLRDFVGDLLNTAATDVGLPNFFLKVVDLLQNGLEVPEPFLLAIREEADDYDRIACRRLMLSEEGVGYNVEEYLPYFRKARAAAAIVEAATANAGSSLKESLYEALFAVRDRAGLLNRIASRYGLRTSSSDSHNEINGGCQ